MIFTLITRALRAFQRATKAVGNGGEVIHNIISDIRNDGVSFHDIMTNSRYSCISVCHILLEPESEQRCSLK